MAPNPRVCCVCGKDARGSIGSGQILFGYCENPRHADSALEKAQERIEKWREIAKDGIRRALR